MSLARTAATVLVRLAPLVPRPVGRACIRLAVGIARHSRLTWTAERRLRRLRGVADRLYLFAHEVECEGVRAYEFVGPCPHAVDRLWNRYVYPVLDRVVFP